jgi:hypothetical protein
LKTCLKKIRNILLQRSNCSLHVSFTLSMEKIHNRICTKF